MTKDFKDHAAACRFLNEIGIISQLSGNAFERALPDDMTLPQFSVLNHFQRLGGEWTPLRLSRAFQVTKGAMTNTLAHLERKGFVAVRPNEKDGRSKQVSLTETGSAAHRRALQAAAPLLDELLGEFPAGELAAALPLLEHMRAWLDEKRNAN